VKAWARAGPKGSPEQLNMGVKGFDFGS